MSIPHVNEEQAPVKYHLHYSPDNPLSGFYIDLPSNEYAITDISSLAADLDSSHFIHVATSFVIVSLLLHINGSDVFIRTLLHFMSDGVGAFRTALPQNLLFRSDIFGTPAN